MTSAAAVLDHKALPEISAPAHAVAAEARRGLTAAQKSLAPWLFYDEAGSQLFEQITALPEYYLTHTERALFAAHAADIFAELGLSLNKIDEVSSPVSTNGHSRPSAPLSFPRPLTPKITLAELGAGTAAKTGILLRALTQIQREVLYQPIDISPTALDEAKSQIERTIPGVTVRPRIANYITDRFSIERLPHTRILALYIGSSIGNFSPAEARAILARLRAHLEPGDSLLLGVDLAPSLAGTTPQKSVSTLLAAYNDAAQVTAAFNRNVLVRLHRELGANFDPARFAHRALWNPMHSRIEMHLVSLDRQTVILPRSSAGPTLPIHFAPGETIHTENSYKFTPAALVSLLAATRFTPARSFTDPANLFAVTLAIAG